MKFITLTLISAVPAFAGSDLPADLAANPNLSSLTNQVIQYEEARQEHLADRQDALDKLATARLELAFAQKQHDRGAKLVSTTTITKEQFSLLQYQLQQGRDDVASLECQARRHEQLARSYLLMSTRPANGGDEKVAEILTARLEAEKARKCDLEARLEAARDKNARLELKFANGDGLVRANSISRLDYDQRELNAKKSGAEIRSLTNQIELSEGHARRLEDLLRQNR